MNDTGVVPEQVNLDVSQLNYVTTLFGKLRVQSANVDPSHFRHPKFKQTQWYSPFSVPSD